MREIRVFERSRLRLRDFFSLSLSLSPYISLLYRFLLPFRTLTCSFLVFFISASFFFFFCSCTEDNIRTIRASIKTFLIVRFLLAKSICCTGETGKIKEEVILDTRWSIAKSELSLRTEHQYSRF